MPPDNPPHTHILFKKKKNLSSLRQQPLKNKVCGVMDLWFFTRVSLSYPSSLSTHSCHSFSSEIHVHSRFSQGAHPALEFFFTRVSGGPLRRQSSQRSATSNPSLCSKQIRDYIFLRLLQLSIKIHLTHHYGTKLNPFAFTECPARRNLCVLSGRETQCFPLQLSRV